jgi:hypothetical protein
MSNYWSSGSGRIELNLSMDIASKGYHSGACDLDIAELRTMAFIDNQLKAISPELLISELKECGAWDSEELANHEDNLDRLLWLACGDLVDQQFNN